MEALRSDYTERAALEALATYASQVPAAQAIVEIGSYDGQSACWLGTGSDRGNRAHVFCIDPWSGGWAGIPPMDEVMAGFLRRIREHGLEDIITPLRARSTDVAQIWLQPIGLLFVDGDHHYRGVSADLEGWMPHLAEDGVVAMHDADRRGVARVIEERGWAGQMVEGTSLWVRTPAGAVVMDARTSPPARDCAPSTVSLT